jgi:uncharacterized protein YjbI with pentapeptide repeats
MKAPKSLADLTFAAQLAPGKADDLEVDGDCDRTHFADLTLTDASASGARFLECAFTGVTFDGGRMRRSRLSEVWFGQTRFVALDAAESSLTDVWLNGSVLAGMQAFGLLMRRVTFRGCKLDSVNFRESTLTDVTFSDCVLRETDFSGGKLTRVRFPGCQLAGVSFSNVTCSDVDLRGATLGGEDASGASAPGIRSGYDSLRGTRIDPLQLMTIAPLLAHHLGISVEEA